MESVLVIDESGVWCQGVAAGLGKAGYNVIFACRMKDALRAMKTYHPGLILLDVAISSMDGVAFLRYLRRRADTVQIPVIITTAEADQDLLSGANFWRIEAVLVKNGFTLKNLPAWVKGYLKAA